MPPPDFHQARKRFGQNFLHDAGVIQRIAAAVAAKPGQQVVEIGPGRGALTEALLLTTDGVLQVIELDRDLIPILRTRFFNFPNLSIHEGDALKFDFATLAAPELPLRVVGNLPYNISTPLIFHLLEHAGRIQDMHFMLQQEVVDRLTAQPGSRAYGRLGIMVQYYCEAEALFGVPPTAFSPQPKVNSAIVRLTPHREMPIVAKDERRLRNVVRTAFAHRRKTLRNNLKGLVTEEQIRALDIDPGSRAEQLTLSNFVAISDTLGSEQDAAP